MFGLYVVRGILRARSPVYHGGDEKTGSVCMLNREKFLLEDGVEEIPIISGNAVRGVLRRMIMRDLLDNVGYEIDVSKKGGIRLYHALFTGGILESVEKDAGQIDVEMKRKIMSLLPPVRLFGLSIGNQMVEGKLKVGQMLPVCEELKGLIPVESSLSFYDLLTKTFQTRKDDLRAEREEGDQAVQMMVEYEVFAPGTRFYHEIKLEDPDAVDISCLARCIELWKQKPFIGGKSAVGFGELEIEYDIDATSDEYLQFLADNREAIVSLLRELEHRKW